MLGHRHQRRRTALAVALSLIAGPAGAQEASWAAGRAPIAPDADVAMCEAFIRSGLADPQSYQRQSVERSDEPAAVDDYIALIGEVGTYPEISDVIRQDAADLGFGLRDVTLRGVSPVAGRPTPRTDRCRFELYGGRLSDQAELSRRLEALLSRRETLAALAGRGEAGMREAADAMTCCLLN